MTSPGDGTGPSPTSPRRHDDGAAEGPDDSTVDDGSAVVDDHTFDLLQALTSSLEALDAYREYAAGTPGSVFDELAAQERTQATRLLAALRQRLAG